MEIKIQSIHFDATDKLEAFIEKKVAKLEKAFEDIQKVEVQCKLVKPATAQNKEVSMSVAVPGTATLMLTSLFCDVAGLTSLHCTSTFWISSKAFSNLATFFSINASNLSVASK